MAQAELDTSDFWNPQAPRLDPNTGQYTTPPPPTIQAAPFTGGNPQANPDQYAKLEAFRSAGRQAGTRIDETDANVFADPRFQQWQMGGSLPSSLMPDQFDDPYTKQLEGIAKAQMGEVRNNPGLNQLTQFLNQQFKELSTSPGFSPAELSVLNTQAFEPIEELRKAAQNRSTQRTAARGFLPSSGLAELDARNIDQEFDKLRTGSSRDLAVRAIDRRDSDLARAGQLAAQLGLQIPQSQRSEELNLANLLYGLPRNALMDALAVVNGSGSPSDLYSGANSLAQQQWLQQQQQAQMWNQIAQLLSAIL